METRDLITALMFGLLGGMLVGVSQRLLSNLTPKKPGLTLGLSVLAPSVVWFAVTFGFLAFRGSNISDWVAMSALITGFGVFALSVVGVLLRKTIPAMSNIILFLITITFLSVCSQIGWLLVRMP